MRNLLILPALLFLIFVCVPALFLLIIGDQPREGSRIFYLGPRQVSSESDFKYQRALQEARQYEKRGAMAEAEKAYLGAAETNRFNLPSYYPLLAAAKCNIALGKKDEAVKQLDSFIESAKEELKILPPRRFEIGETTPDQERLVRGLLQEADELKRSVTTPSRSK